MSVFDQLPYEWTVGLRYTRAGKRSRRNSFISFISLISITCIALGVAALIIVMSVMNGFQKEVTDRMLSVLAHVEVFDARGSMSDWQESARLAQKNPQVTGAAPFAETQGMLMSDGVMRPAIVRGVLPAEEGKVSDVPRHVATGSFDALRAGEFNIILGIELAKALSLKVGDKVTMAVAPAQTVAEPSGMAPRMVNFTVAGTFDVGHFEFDSGLAFIHLADAQNVAGVDGPAGLRLRLSDLHKAPEVAQELHASMPGELFIRDWTKQNSIWFAAVRSQKTMMFVILSLIIGVAAFNLVAMLVMTVTDKQADIAILRTLGSSQVSIMKIFMVQGALVGIAGTAMGVGFGVLVALNIDVIIPFFERLFGIHFLSKDIYFISTLPSDLRLTDILGVAVVAMVLSFFATLYPSYAASRVKPAEALRYE